MKNILAIAAWLSKLTGIRGDYILHFGVCFLLSLFGSYGVVFALGLSLGKEFGDKNNPNSGWSWGDLLADGLGIGFGLTFNFIIKWLLKLVN